MATPESLVVEHRQDVHLLVEGQSNWPISLVTGTVKALADLVQAVCFCAACLIPDELVTNFLLYIE